MVDNDLHIKGGGGRGEGGLGYLDPEIRRAGAGFTKTFFLPLGPQFGLKIRGTGPSPRFASALYCTQCISSFVTTKHQQCRFIWVSVFECRFKMFKNCYYCLQRNKYYLCQNVEPIKHPVCGLWAVQLSSFRMPVFIVVVTQVIQAL